MYGNYFNIRSQQADIERINSQINELEKMRNQLSNPPTQPTNLTQNFQFTPNSMGIRFANTIDDVFKEIVFTDTPFFSKDMSVMWLKNQKNEIKTFELKEIVPKDDKDIYIETLESRLEELERKINNEQQNVTNVIEAEIPTNTTRVDKQTSSTTNESKSSSVSRVSKSSSK